MIKYLVLVGALTLISLSDTTAQDINPKYDEALAKKLGADDYGMKMYTLVILKTGANTSTDSIARSEAFEGHMSNMNVMVAEGQLIVAGPLGQNDHQYRGIFVLDLDDIEIAEELLQTDPAIKAGFLAYDVFPWYGSAALPEYLPASEKVNRIQF